MPSRRSVLKPAAFSGASSKSSIVRNCENTTDFVVGLSSRTADRCLRRAVTLDDGAEEERFPSVTESEVSDGAKKRSASVSGWRHIGQQDFIRCIVFRMHILQKMWPQLVITVFFGGEIQTGQSIPSSSCSAISILSNSFGLLFTSVFIQLTPKSDHFPITKNTKINQSEKMFI